jgi:uncharacterized membrane protein YeaQ/YmgE (transglycosylase-associated protein family)
MDNSDTKKRWINRPFVKGFLAGIVVPAACNLSQLFTGWFDSTIESPLFERMLFLSIGVSIVALLIFGWLANWILSRFGFEGFKISGDWQAGTMPGFILGFFVYVFVGAIIAMVIGRLLGASIPTF